MITNMNIIDEIEKNFWATQIPLLILKFADQALETKEAEETVERYKAECQQEVNIIMNK